MATPKTIVGKKTDNQWTVRYEERGPDGSACMLVAQGDTRQQAMDRLMLLLDEHARDGGEP